MTGDPFDGIDPAEGFARVRLLRSPRIGPVTFARLMARCGSAVAALAAVPDIVAASGGKPWRAADESGIRAEVRAVAQAGARYLFAGIADYPAWLAPVPGAPPVLMAIGTMPQGLPVAIVGARNASAGGLRIARDIAHDLAAAGHPVVSGLARGIDGAAHQGALAARGAGTIGVIGCGIDVCFPPQHADLQAQVAREGALLTEYPPGTEPLARHFPARNRIIAGIAAACVVVEAAPKSGSLLTARLAGDIGRDTMAVPGSPLDPRSQGTNGLIREGATLVQNAAEIIEMLTGFDGTPRAPAVVAEPVGRFDHAPAASDGPEAGEMELPDIAALVGVAPVGVDELARASGIPAAAVNAVLTDLELAGRLLRHAGGRVSLAP